MGRDRTKYWHRSPSDAGGAPEVDNLLLEDGDDVLLEGGDLLLLE
jgi:hypothetical protein